MILVNLLSNANCKWAWIILNKWWNIISLLDLKKEFIFPYLKLVQEQKCLKCIWEIPLMQSRRKNSGSLEKEQMGTLEMIYQSWSVMHCCSLSGRSRQQHTLDEWVDIYWFDSEIESYVKLVKNTALTEALFVSPSLVWLNV